MRTLAVVWAIGFSLLMSTCLIGCQPESPLNPKGEPELRGFIVKRCYDEECLKGWLSRLSDKTGCYVLSVSSTYEAGYKAVSGVYTYTIIAECPDEPATPVCGDGGHG
jgi:hypothetical protein